MSGADSSRRSPGSGGDLMAELQRWLIRSGARNLRRDLGDQVRTAFGGSQPSPDEVWGAATTEPPLAGEAPECAWCPVCRAARRLQENRPGLGSQLAGAGDAVALAVRDALLALDAALARAGAPDTARQDGAQRPSAPGPESRDTADPWGAASDDPAGEPRREPDDRD